MRGLAQNFVDTIFTLVYYGTLSIREECPAMKFGVHSRHAIRDATLATPSHDFPTKLIRSNRPRKKQSRSWRFCVKEF